jgi:hypothetical protein
MKLAWEQAKRSPCRDSIPARLAVRIPRACSTPPSVGVRHLRTSANTRAGCERQTPRICDLLERESVELRRDFALKPGLVAGARMLARPAAIAAMPVADRLASRAVYGCASARIAAGLGLRSERFACDCDCAKAMLASPFRRRAVQLRGYAKRLARCGLAGAA